MSRKNQMMGGIVILALAAGGLFFWYQASQATSAEIAAKTESFEQVDPKLLDAKVFETINQLEINGKIPVVVSDTEKGKADPFVR